MMKIVFATGNSGKLREASEILGEGFELVTPADFGITEDTREAPRTYGFLPYMHRISPFGAAISLV